MYATLSPANMSDKRIPVIDRTSENGHHKPMSAHQNKALMALTFTTLVWGVTPVFVRSFSLLLGPTQALIIRLVLTGLVFAIVLALTTGFKMDRRDLAKLALLSLIGMLGYYVGTVFGFAYAPAGVGTLIVSTQPLLIAILAWLIGTERLGLATVVGLAVSFAGSVLLVWGGRADGASAANASLAFGCVLIFLAGLGWCIFVVFSKPLIQRYGALKITGLSNVIILLPALPFISSDTVTAFVGMDQNAAFSLAFLILIGATAAVFTWNYAAGHLRPSLLGSALYILPVLALGAGWAILHETITLNTIIAAAIILTGVAISQVKLKLRTAT
jgi:drug/metabolite transporter (DMT)-like permease